MLMFGTPRPQDGRSLVVYTPKRRVRIKICDTYFASALAMKFAMGYEGPVEICGILKSGRTQLRVRIPEIIAAALHPGSAPEASETIAAAAPARWTGAGGAQAPPPPDEMWVEEVGAELPEAEALDEADAVRTWSEDLDEAVDLANTVLGYPIDDFQRRSLAVILKQDTDLLAMAPTGSGKTAVALLAILQAFARGKKAIYTSPIKALSNQKYAEFKQWFRAKGVQGEVTLLTGDIKIRAPPGTKNELLICTSEILRNKLVKSSGIKQAELSNSQGGASNAQPAGPDPDLDRLGCVVSDEVHYINDPERGAVWEETLMHLSTEVQLVALSATL